MYEIKIKQQWALLVINVTRKERKKSCNSLCKTHFPTLNFSLFLTFNTLISHVRTNPRLKWEKFSTGAAAKALSGVAQVDWVDGESVWSPVSLFEKRPQRAFHGSGVCRGHAGFSWQGPPQVLAAARMKRIFWVDTRWQELMWSSTSVTAFISYATPLIPRPGDISDTVF